MSFGVPPPTRSPVHLFMGASVSADSAVPSVKSVKSAEKCGHALAQRPPWGREEHAMALIIKGTPPSSRPAIHTIGS
eukprot:CAMPEP_0171213082 /NCGR_PEP_ID=MMETSP0790-20130122/30462_1 /TAXON_ID=2925 /ORGANISM="Alexandrium catenella, Strain OF101" /LENGTH=76 /DNA_ID=CAMNT_0011678781 /DNA_START=65 /DNA_END=292 /DNA_ORIENTATION=-